MLVAKQVAVTVYIGSLVYFTWNVVLEITFVRHCFPAIYSIF